MLDDPSSKSLAELKTGLLAGHKQWLESHHREGQRLVPELLEPLLAAHRAWLDSEGKEGQRLDLRRAELRGADLHRLDLSQVNLAMADLRAADLREATLVGADLRDADLSEAKARGADLKGADLRAADLSWGDFAGADLRGANLRVANLSWCGLQGADLSTARADLADLREADLADANLSMADLRVANLSDSDLSNVQFGLANLSEANLAGAELRGALLDDAVGLPRRLAREAGSERGLERLIENLQRRLDEHERSESQENGEAQVQRRALEQRLESLQTALDELKTSNAQQRRVTEQEVDQAIAVLSATMGDTDRVIAINRRRSRLFVGLALGAFTAALLLLTPLRGWLLPLPRGASDGLAGLLTLGPSLLAVLIGVACLRHDMHITRARLRLAEHKRTLEHAIGLLRAACHLSRVDVLPPLVLATFEGLRDSLLAAGRPATAAHPDEAVADGHGAALGSVLRLLGERGRR